MEETPKKERHRGRRMMRKNDPRRVKNIKRMRNRHHKALGRKEKTVASKFGMFVKAKRLAKGVSQSKFATACGISTTYLREIEKGNRRAPSERVIAAMIHALDLSELDEMDLRVVSGRSVYCPKCGHGFMPDARIDNIPADYKDKLIENGRIAAPKLPMPEDPR